MAGYSLSRQKTDLLPAESSHLPWFHRTQPPKLRDGNQVKVITSGKDADFVHYEFVIARGQDNPYTAFNFYFTEPKVVADLVDLSQYTSIDFTIECDPKNILVFALYSFVEGVTQLEAPETFRVSLDFLTCEKRPSKVSFALKELDSIDWWIERYGLAYTNRDASLDKVHGFSLNNSLQSPRGVESNVRVKDLTLVKEDFRLFYGSVVFTFFVWLGFGFWMTKSYVKGLIQTANSQINTNQPLVAYQKLSISQNSNDLKTKLFQHIAVEYSNPDLRIETTANALATTRSKINEILKAELGLTFTAYVNKIRLTEAARLLVEDDDLSVKQISFEVGFVNVTYFNTLFKKEYGCSPKVFKSNCPA